MELRANDFRSGNLILHKNEVWVINDIHGASGLITVYPKGSESLGRRSIHDFQPIPLTDEWLIKFGFEADIDGDCTLGTILYYGQSRNPYKRGKALWIACDEDYFYDFPTSVQYVHQLQNLYYALTGEELTINDKP